MKSWPALRIFLSLALGIWSACSQAWGFLTLPPEPLSFLMLFAVGSFFSLAMLFIAGEFDEARPERMMQFQQLIPGSQLMIIEDAAHASYRKKPEEYAAALQSFLEAIDPEN